MWVVATLPVFGKVIIMLSATTSCVIIVLTGIALVGIMIIFPLQFFALFASIHGVVQILSQIVGLVYILLL